LQLFLQIIYAIRLFLLVSEGLYKRGGKFVLGYKVNTTHITIAHFECFNKISLKNVIEKVEMQTNYLQAFNINQDNYRINDGWVNMAFELNKELLSLYDRVFDILKKNNCVKTSNDWRKEDKLPHITFSRFNDSEVFDIETLSKQDFSFTVDKIGIFELGEHGTNKKLLKECELQ